MNRILNEHRQRNAASLNCWDGFAAHRRQVTDLLIGAQQATCGRLCVLGAGNCNDLELSALSRAFAEVHLVDLDEPAVRAGIAAQNPAHPERVFVHTADLAGCNEILRDWTPDLPPPETEVQRCLKAAATCPAPQLPGPFDVVASVGLLTQLFDSVAISLGGKHPRYLDVLTAIRLRHVRLLFELLAPGAAALLITDFVSSSTYPSLASTSPADLPRVSAQLIQSRNFFTGVNPGVLHALFKTDAVIGPQLEHLEMSPPWLWDFGPRTYAVYAIQARCRRSN